MESQIRNNTTIEGRKRNTGRSLLVGCRLHREIGRGRVRGMRVIRGKGAIDKG